MLEIERVVSFVAEHLYTDATFIGVVGGGVWRGTAPPGTAYPLAVVSGVSSVPTTTLGARRVWDNDLVLLTIWDNLDDRARLRQAGDRADFLLGEKTATYDGVHLVKLRRESAPQVPVQPEDGEARGRLDMVFRTEAHAA